MRWLSKSEQHYNQEQILIIQYKKLTEQISKSSYFFQISFMMQI